jgi:hypothetical protein
MDRRLKKPLPGFLSLDLLLSGSAPAAPFPDDSEVAPVTASGLEVSDSVCANVCGLVDKAKKAIAERISLDFIFCIFFFRVQKYSDMKSAAIPKNRYYRT